MPIQQLQKVLFYKNMVKNAKYLEILPLLSCERRNPSDNGEGKIQNAILRF